MLVKIVLVVAVLAAALVVAQRMDVVHEWGVAGSCEGVRAPVDDGSSWYACKEGLITGYPSLIGDQCKYEQRTTSTGAAPSRSHASVRASEPAVTASG
jgi:hypothetical protein